VDVVKIDHNPAVPAALCAACRAGQIGFDHEAVLRHRPANFDARVIELVRRVANGATDLDGISLHPDAPKRARRWLAERGLT
jgi:hypothetical protein